MPSWNADQYLKFAHERTQPARDLAARIAVDGPRKVIDLGCGPGNSTALLAERWPVAAITGLDSSSAMIRAAEREYPQFHWMAGDISGWAAEPDTLPDNLFDVVFSNAALQWVTDHPTLYPALFRHVAPGGALAIQVPMNMNAPAHVAMRELASTPAWACMLPSEGVREWHVHDARFYYDLLSSLAARLELWETEYLHVMEDARAIVEWYKGTGLRPFLDALPSEADRENFLADYADRLDDAYPAQADGRVLFPFRRFFLIAYR
ncbi:MAG: Trans-aconitate 2-methyltransferase [Rhodospirillales bacterium]|nr:Trans-aconitate 2-methyltransferase [Rhodospirillales bacterium]